MKRLTSLLLLGVGILSLSGLLSCSVTDIPTPIHEPPPPAVTVISAPTEMPLPTPTVTARPENTPTGTSVPTSPPATIQPTIPPATIQPTVPMANVQPTNPPATSMPSSPNAAVPAPCAEQVCIEPGTFLLQRPIAPPGRNTVDTSYRFGDDDGGLRDVHHGVEFLNSSGTPVLAAADGTVVVAGDDKKTIYGLYPNGYGNLVVIQHSFPGISQPVFSVYGHLSKIDVKQGDAVQTGQKIGEVGATGAATGPHLHFEVRLGENTYAASRNPELWLKPLTDEQGLLEGGIAGSILSANGSQVSVPNIVIQPISTTGSAADVTSYIHTYDEKKLAGQSPWDESFAAGGLPSGQYKVSFIQNGYHTLIVQVQPGELTLVTFRLDQ